VPGLDPGPLRVVHVVPSLNVAGGGPARSVLRLASGQRRLGARALVVTGNHRQGANDDPAADPGRDSEVRYCRQLPLPFELPSREMLRVLEQEIAGADLVHLHSLWNGTITAAARIARQSAVPYVISPRGMLDPKAVRQKRVLKRLYRAVMDRSTSTGAAGFHFLTADELDAAAWPPHAGQRTSVIPNGVEVDAVQRAAGSFSPSLFADGGPNLLYLGRLHPSKGLELQLEALRLLKDKGIDARLFFVGPDEGEGARLKRLARGARVDERMEVLAPIYGDQRFALLRAADCVLLTSHFEGNSVSAMETMAAGGLLIATDTTHLDEAARHQAAVVVNREARAVSEAVARVLRTPAFCRSVRGQAVEYARAKLESAVISRRMLSFYDEVLGAALVDGGRT
jgi:glycosyltransferase involved in cell wall biosynthesis